MEAAVQEREAPGAPVAKLNKMARSMGHSRDFRSKAEALKAHRQQALGRKGAFGGVDV